MLDTNKLYDQMEDILSENRYLRGLAPVPKNFGINIQEIKLGDRKKIEDYEAKNRILMQRIDELETERAQLVSSKLFLASAFQTEDQNFSQLSSKEKLIVANYAQALHEGRVPIIPERYELLNEKERLLNKIDVLEKHLQGLQVDSWKINFNEKQQPKQIIQQHQPVNVKMFFLNYYIGEFREGFRCIKEGK